MTEGARQALRARAEQWIHQLEAQEGLDGVAGLSEDYCLIRDLLAAVDALQQEKTEILASVSADGYGMALVTICETCHQPYPDWGVSSRLTCHECRRTAQLQAMTTRVQALEDCLRAIRARASKAEDDYPDLAHPTDIIDMVDEQGATLTQQGAAGQETR